MSAEIATSAALAIKQIAIETAAPDLPALAGKINAAHHQVKSALNRSAGYAIETGLLLLQAKKAVGHGNFAEWVGANCAFSERTCQLYMQLARKFPNPQSFADFTISDLMAELAPLRLAALKDEPKAKKAKAEKADPVDAAIKADGALAVLKRAWDAAGDTQRRSFVRAYIKPDNAVPSV